MMTKSRALSRARVMFGKDAYVSARREKNDKTGEWRDRYLVGHTIGTGGMRFFDIDGEGASWEEAIERADRRKRGASMTLLPEEWEALVEHCNLEALPAPVLDRLHDFMAYVRREEAKRAG